METIKCRKCGKELPLDMFYKNKASENGYQTICKECWNEYIKTLKSKKESMGPVSCNNSRGVHGNPDLAQFTPRQLIEELRARGYYGELKYTNIIKV